MAQQISLFDNFEEQIGDYSVVFNREIIGKNTFAYIKAHKSKLKTYFYTKEEKEMLIGYGYCLISSFFIHL
jgi:predicted nucleic acid-binding Zn finger protein